MMSKWALMAVVSLSAIVSLCLTSNNPDTTTLPLTSRSLTNSTRLDSTSTASLEYDFYQNTCPQAESIILSIVKNTLLHNSNSTAQLLRLMFHDCFIEGCDASVLIAGVNGSSTEQDAIPNKTLKGFQFVEMIKEEIEKECPGIVSCADILVLSVRDSIVMSGGPFYPISTGRRDSIRAYQDKAEDEIPRPMSKVSEFLRLFSLRGFDERETTALIGGGHNIGHISCQFLAPRFSEFSSSPDPTMDANFFEELREKCISNTSSIPNGLDPSRASRHLTHASHRPSSTLGGSATHSQELISGEQSFSSFDGHYFRSLVVGKGILFSDQQLMSFEKTAKVVQEYASDEAKFRLDFARAMVKMSNLGVLTGSQGQIRRNCSIPLNVQLD